MELYFFVPHLSSWCGQEQLCLLQPCSRRGHMQGNWPLSSPYSAPWSILQPSVDSIDWLLAVQKRRHEWKWKNRLVCPLSQASDSWQCVSVVIFIRAFASTLKFAPLALPCLSVRTYRQSFHSVRRWSRFYYSLSTDASFDLHRTGENTSHENLTSFCSPLAE